MADKAKAKIGIMTFHWAANYGAVLQAWALQNYLVDEGYQTEIINYIPSNLKISLRRCFMTRHLNTMKLRYKEFKKEQLIKRFRDQQLICSPIEYSSKDQLIKTPPIYDYYISGSDQIWNPYFTMGGQKGITLSYYLDFAPKDRRRIAFSSSFGCKLLPEKVAETVKPELKKYYSISTREAEGVDILRNMGINAVNTADPTLLLYADKYEKLLPMKKEKNNNIYVYILHGQRSLADSLIDHIKTLTNLNVCDDDELSVEDWLTHIRDSKFVITNSFHCVVFCLLFHVPFYAIDVQGKDMSSRITTLLGSVGLEDRFLTLPISLERIKDSSIQAVSWEAVEGGLGRIRSFSRDYLTKALTDRVRVDDVPKSQCTGCGLCSVVCPKKCISMVEDNYGFIFPTINESDCIHCKLCAEKCIVENKKDNEGQVIETHSAWNVREDIRRESSSGGVFTALAETIIENSGIVYGAEYVGPLSVKHSGVKTNSELSKLRGSKYQPSEAWDVFEEIKKEIHKGTTILFTGTPCQVAVLKKYIGPSNSLFCVDIACHGVPSLKLLKEKCDSISAHKVYSVSFRDKRTGWQDYSCVYYDKNGNEIAHEFASESDFMRGYLSNLYIRESCEGCRFAAIPRVGDISLADCWIKVHNGTNVDDKGITAVLINTDTGKQLYDEAKNMLASEPISIDEVLKGTPTLSQGSKQSKERAIFWDYYRRNGYSSSMKKFFGITIMKRKVLRLLKSKS